jgi:hypothetical protein
MLQASADVERALISGLPVSHRAVHLTLEVINVEKFAALLANVHRITICKDEIDSAQKIYGKVCECVCVCVWSVRVQVSTFRLCRVCTCVL